MLLNAQIVPEPALDPQETLLRRRDDAWSLRDKNLLRRAGVKVRDVPKEPGLIAIVGRPRSNQTIAQVVGHDRFGVESQEARLKLVPTA
jgi:hypothetical protein